MLLSKHFSLNEFILSHYAVTHNIDNHPTHKVIKNLTKLCNSVLEPCRAAVDHPIIINSGYRCVKLNRAVGGVYNSNHLYGLAVDIPYSADVWNYLYHLQSCRVVNELLHERRFKCEWIHVSVYP